MNGALAHRVEGGGQAQRQEMWVGGVPIAAFAYARVCVRVVAEMRANLVSSGKG